MQSIGPTDSGLPLERAFAANGRSLHTSLERLSTGHKINRAADGPAALITSENLRSVLAALDAETRSLQRSDQVVATADGALAEISDLLGEAEALVVANANGAGLSAAEKEANQLALDSIVNSANRIAHSTSFNGTNLLDGSARVGTEDRGVDIADASIEHPGEGEAAQTSLAETRSRIATMRGELGAFSKHVIGSSLDSVGVAMENVAAAESSIRDTDYGQEVASLARAQLLTQGNVYTMSLATSEAKNVLRLLG